MVSRLYLVVVKRGHAEIAHNVISNLSHTLIPFTHNICDVFILSFLYFHDIPCFINIQNLYPDYFVLWLFFLKAIIFGLKIKCDYPISKLNVAFNRIKHLSWYYYFDREWNSLQGCDLDLSPQLFSFCYLMILKYMIMVNLSARIEKNRGCFMELL